MKRIIFLVGAWWALSVSVTVLSAQTLAGGFARASVTNQEVRDAAAFAIQSQTKLMQGQKDGQATTLELVKILAAEQQVVAGMNYRLKLQVKVNGRDKQAEVTVWWQAWRKPEPYELSAWKWSGE
jgi:hypothetical protein